MEAYISTSTSYQGDCFEPMKIATFAEIAEEFLERVNKMVWCNVATVDQKEH